MRSNQNNVAHKPSKCPKCSCLVMVWKREGVKAPLLRKMALADHHQSLHAPRSWQDRQHAAQVERRWRNRNPLR